MICENFQKQIEQVDNLFDINCIILDLIDIRLQEKAFKKNTHKNQNDCFNLNGLNSQGVSQKR